MPTGEHLKVEAPKANPQLFKNSALQSLFADSPPPPTPGLFNPRDPNLQIQHEKPEHRLFLWMKAQGASNREIARESGYTESWISQLFRQPWAQAKLVEMLRESGKGVLEQTLAIIQSEAINSVQTLVEIRDDTDAPKAVRRACSVDLIEQFLGKPKQHVDVVQSDKAEDVSELDRKLLQVEEELKQLTGGTGNQN